jgi:preprotein translocase subunit YajC
VQGSGFLIVLVGIFAVMYFLLIRPQNAKKRAMQDMLSKIGPGDEVITIGGIYGDVVEVSDDRVVLEIAEDVHIEVARRAIAQIVPQESAFGADEDGDEEENVFGEGSTDEEDVFDGEPEADVDEIPEPEPVREEKRRGVFGRRSG